MKKEPDTSRPIDKAEEGGEKSPEYAAFEAFARKALSVPKAEIDRREQAAKDGGAVVSGD